MISGGFAMNNNTGYSFYLGDILLPIAPGKLEIRYGNKIRRVDLASGVEVGFSETVKLREIKFSALLPRVKYPFAIYRNGFVSGGTILIDILELKRQNKPFRFIITRGVTASKVSLASTNMKVMFAEINVREEADDGNDIHIDVKLIEQREVAINSAVTARGGSDTARAEAVLVRPVDTAPVVNTYTVVRGDSLWLIAHRFLGNGNRWGEIYNLNKDMIDSRNRGTGNPYHTIYPGQVFSIPGSGV
jgi:LysM repeat protein